MLVASQIEKRKKVEVNIGIDQSLVLGNQLDVATINKRDTLDVIAL